MKLKINPGVTLMRSLIPGEPVSLRQAIDSFALTEQAAQSLFTELAECCEQLELRDGTLTLTEALDLYDPERLVSRLSASITARVDSASFHALCESTNTGSTAMNVAAANTLSLAFADFQTGGRGRQGRSWRSGYAQGVCFTASFRFPPEVALRSTLTLATGVALAEALDHHVTEPVMIKWPNDLVLGEGKLGGILVEVSSTGGQDQLVRIGVGINCEAPSFDPMSGALPALAPAGLAGRSRRPLDRTAIAADLVNAVVAAVDKHGEQGLDPFRAQWNHRDYLRHQAVQVHDDERVRHGTANGIDQHGALRVTTDQGELHLTSGEVRVRKQ